MMTKNGDIVNCFGAPCASRATRGVGSAASAWPLPESSIRIGTTRWRPSKYPPAFGIDLHVDDSPGIAIEGEQHGFRVLVIASDDPGWVTRVLEAVAAVAKSLTNFLFGIRQVPRSRLISCSRSLPLFRLVLRRRGDFEPFRGLD